MGEEGDVLKRCLSSFLDVRGRGMTQNDTHKSLSLPAGIYTVSLGLMGKQIELLHYKEGH